MEEEQLDGSNDGEAIDAEWEIIQEEDNTRIKRSVALRRKRATVTSNFRSRSGHRIRGSRFGERYPVYSGKG